MSATMITILEPFFVIFSYPIPILPSPSPKPALIYSFPLWISLFWAFHIHIHRETYKM